MRNLVRATVVAALITSGPALAQGFGGPLQPAEPGSFRFDLDVGASRPQFSRFRYGDVRESFPSVNSPAIADAFNERDYGDAYNLGLRGSFGLPSPVFGAPLEIYGRFHYFDAERQSLMQQTPPNFVFVPYIDAVVRPGLSGAVVGLFDRSAQELRRRLTSFEGELGLRQHFTIDSWNVSPSIFFDYQRLQQRDRLSTALAVDPSEHTLHADVNSDHFRIGAGVKFARPILREDFIWQLAVAGGVDFVRARYRGSQAFGGSVFDDPNEQFASARDSRSRVGGFVGVETGLTYWLFPGMSVSLMGNVRYITALPFVRYPTLILDSRNVSGPAVLGFQGQLTYGGVLNVSIKM